MDLRNYEKTIVGDRVYLRTLEPGDASEAYCRWLNDPLVNAYLRTRNATTQDISNYIQEKAENPAAVLFGIFWKETDEHIGNVKLEPVDRAEGFADMGILIGNTAFWGKGVATEVTNLMVEYAWSELAIPRVILGVDTDNTAARRVYEKCGFRVYGVKKDFLSYEGGVTRDMICMEKCRDV